jgi:hypothetical protein
MQVKEKEKDFFGGEIFLKDRVKIRDDFGVFTHDSDANDPVCLLDHRSE